MVYDIAIIGSGPAGVSAVINAKILNKSYIWLSAKSTSDKVSKEELIKTSPGLPSVTGAELNWTFKNHCDAMYIENTQGIVTGVYETGGKFTLLAGNKDYEAKTVILCLGVQSKKPLDGEELFLGRGVSYCATCDGNLYRGKTIAVLATDKAFEHEIEYLCSLAQKVYVMPMYQNCFISAKNAELVMKAPLKITGGMRAEEVVFKDGKLKVDGVFILRDAVSPFTLVHGLKIVDGHIEVSRRMETNIKGMYAAGDCTGRPYQYIKAAGEGNVAVHFAVEYLSKLKKD